MENPLAIVSSQVEQDLRKFSNRVRVSIPFDASE